MTLLSTDRVHESASPFEEADPAPRPNSSGRQSREVFGLPLAPFTLAEALGEIDSLVAAENPAYFITANLNYAMLAARDARLQAINREAAFIVADGMPLVWAGRWNGAHLPERVAGADLFPLICARAARQGYRVFLLGAAPGAGQEAASRLCQQYPGLSIVGIESPNLDQLSPADNAVLRDRIRVSQANIVFVALGQPKGEIWVAENYRKLGPAVCVQVGCCIDLAAGFVKRAPEWMQRHHLEWAFRLCQEPKRLWKRYAANALFLAEMAAASILSGFVSSRSLKQAKEG